MNLCNKITNVHMHVGDISIDIVLAQSIAQPEPYRDYYREYKTGAHDNYDIKATSYSIPETIARLILCSRESQLILLSVSPVFITYFSYLEMQ